MPLIKKKKIGLSCQNILVFQFHNSLYGSVVVVEVDGADHFCTFEVTNLHCDFADGVTANELDDLLSGGVPGIHFDRGQFYILGTKKSFKKMHTQDTLAMAHGLQSQIIYVPANDFHIMLRFSFSHLYSSLSITCDYMQYNNQQEQLCYTY